MSNQGSSNHGPESNPDVNNQGNQNTPPQSPTPVNQPSQGEPLDAREEQLMLKVADIVRNAFEEFRKENKDTGNKGKGKIEGEGSTGKGVSFKSFRGSGATEFTGIATPVDALEWIENTETVFKISHVSEKDETNYGAALLKGKALAWWKNTYKALSEGEQNYLPWNEFKNRFLEQYCPPDMQRRLEKEFLSIKQENMTVDEYETVFNQKAMFASKYVSNEKDKIQLFVEGLRYEIQDFVANRDIPSFAKAVEYARKREYDLSLRGVVMPNPKRQHVEPSNSISPVSSPQNLSHDQPQLFSISPDTPWNCQKCGKYHKGRCEVSRRSISCYGCGKEGHIRSMCPERNMKCFSCGNKGHLKKNCPTAQRQVTESRASVQQPTKAGSSIQKEEVPQAKSRAYQITPKDTQ